MNGLTIGGMEKPLLMNLDRVPKNLDDAINLIVSNLSQEEKDYILKKDDPFYGYTMHMGFGMWLRNNWSLWDRETVLVKWFIDTYGIGHADDISGLINSGVEAVLAGKVFNVEEQVSRYKTHWKTFGVDPITGEKV